MFGKQEKLTKLKNQYPIIYEACKKLTKEEIESTNYNIEKI
jgi:hypothetical protein